MYINLKKIKIASFYFGIVFYSFSLKSQVNLQWPCGQYVTRQELISGSTYKSVVNVLYTTTSGTVGLDKVCENTSHLFNAAAFYDGYIWAWKQYAGATNSGTSSSLMRLNNDCTVTEYIITFPSGTSTAQFNNAYVDASGNFYMARPGNFPNIIIYKINLNTLVPGTNPTTNTLTTTTFSPNGTAFTGTGNFGDMYFDGTTAYIWQNGQGLASLNLTTNSYTRIGSVNEVAGSLFINAADPGYLYGYGSSALSTDNTTQNTIVKINLSDGTYADVAAGGAAVSQSDGAGCPTATFQEVKPVANPDELLNNPTGTKVTVSPITNNDVVVGGTIDKTTVNLVPPSGATGIVTDAQGNVTSMDIPGEGTWAVNPTTGDISFEPIPSFGGNPTVVEYNVKDDHSNLSNNTTVTVTYVKALPVDLLKFSASFFETQVNIMWKTANEKSFSHFEVQNSGNAVEYATIGSILPNGTNLYNFIDPKPNENVNYYRLKMVDLDGTFKFSNIISVNSKNENSYLTLQNPVANGLIELNTNFKNNKMELVNTMGQRLNISPISTGNNTYMINVSGLQSGIYYFSIISHEKTITRKILIQN